MSYDKGEKVLKAVGFVFFIGGCALRFYVIRAKSAIT